MIKLSKKLENRMRIQKNKFESYTDERIPNVDFKDVHHHLHGHMEIVTPFTALRVSDVLDGSTYDKDREFPELNHVFELPKSDFNAIKIPTKEIEDLINPKNIENGESMNLLYVNINKSDLILHPAHHNKYGDEFEYEDIIVKLPKKVHKEISFMLSPTYLYDAMNFFRMLGISEVSLVIENNHKPIRLLSENIQYVIAQITKK